MAALRRYEFSERLADILGESRRDLRFRVTMMVTAGLVPPGPRGPGSPAATPQYAAEVLIGVLAAPQQVHTLDAIRCYRELEPTTVAAELTAPEITLGSLLSQTGTDDAPQLPLVQERLRFGEILARLLDHARDIETRPVLARALFGIWVSRGFPMAAVQFVAASDARRTVVTQRYELPEGARPPAWLDPERGGVADPGLFHTVFLSASKLIEIGRLTASQGERTARMLTLDHSIFNNLADLAQNSRYRRPWEKFLAMAQKARATAERIDTRVESRLTEVTSFGSNPGNLRMLTYVPKNLPEAAPLVVALHGCTQTAHSYDVGTGWSTYADRYGFAVLLPEQRTSNNPLQAFNWFKPEDVVRDSGEPLSIRQMVEWMAVNHGIDRCRVYVNGVSAGGAMTSVMLATYPEVFAGGAIIAGLPYRCANELQEAFECMFQGRIRSPQEWGKLVRAASSHQGPWPKISIWHGGGDHTVQPTNAEELIKQWTDVHGLSMAPTFESTVDGHPYRAWRGSEGDTLIEAYTITGMAHGVPIDPHGEDGCGAAAPFILDVGISSTRHLARSWGLTDRMPQTSPTPHSAAPIIIPADYRPEDKARPREVRIETGARSDTPAADRPASAQPGHQDLEEIIATSLKAAGLLKGMGQGFSRPAGASSQGAEEGHVTGIDIASILAKSFEAAGILKGGRDVPAEPGALTGSGWEGDGWRLTTDAREGRDDGVVLFGYASSGTGGNFGKTMRSVSRQFSLGQRPKLSYVRRLKLSAAVNILTTASFRVLVDGVPVDEVSAVGMDYEEASWTEHVDIDLAQFAGRTVTLTFEVTANSNVFIEVFAKAWVGDITVRDTL
jgi:poly(hydroxyalkanoate) depolymerase family esterase